MERKGVVSIANKYEKPLAQVLLRWATRQGFGTIPKSMTRSTYIRLGLEAVSDDSRFVLSKEDVKLLNSCDQSHVSSEGYKKDGDAGGRQTRRLTDW